MVEIWSMLYKPVNSLNGNIVEVISIGYQKWFNGYRDPLNKPRNARSPKPKRSKSEKGLQRIKHCFYSYILNLIMY